ncbi:hypothetical protein ACWE42_17600 [Sutcliffiella cohnii]
MDDQLNYNDVPAGENISYEHLLFYLEQGREIEFVYNGNEYFISNSSEGRAIWDGKARISSGISNNYITLIESTNIEGIPLIDLIKQNQINITTVF